MLERRDDYASLYRDFRWIIPERFNIGVAVADRWAAEDPDRTALLDYRADGAPDRLSFPSWRARSNALANALAGAGHTPRRPGRAAPAAELRDGHRACRHLQARRHRRAAGAAVRRRGAGIPPADRRREGWSSPMRRARPSCRGSQDACPASTGSWSSAATEPDDFGRLVADHLGRTSWPKTPALTIRR